MKLIGDKTYFIHNASTNAWKIGRSENVAVRTHTLIRRHGGRVVAVFPHSRVKERECHKMFSHLNIPRLGPEWFRDDPSISQFLALKEKMRQEFIPFIKKPKKDGMYDIKVTLAPDEYLSVVQFASKSGDDLWNAVRCLISRGLQGEKISSPKPSK